MGDPIDKQFGDWFGNYGSNYDDSQQPPMPPPSTPSPGVGFSQFSGSPAPFMGYSGQGYRPYSPPDSQGFGRFRTPSTGAGYATQGLESMNLAASFESASDMPEATATSLSKGKGKAKPKGKGKAKASEVAVLPSGRRAPVSYSPDETLCLANAWVAISEDPTKGTDQTSFQFWLRVHELYNKTRPAGTIVRDTEMLRGHWKRASQKIKDFNGCYNESKAAWRSGQSDADIYANATKLYAEKNNNTPFLLKDAWQQLHNIPKFQNPRKPANTSDSDKRQKGNDGSSYSSRSEDDSGFFSHQRPIGRDTAKGKAAVSDARTTVPYEDLDQMDKESDELESLVVQQAKGKLLRGRHKAFLQYQKAKKLDTSDMTDEELAEHFQMLEELKAFYQSK